MTDENEKQDGLLEWVKTIAYALILAGFIRTIFFQPFWIPSGSMKDTLLIGDFLFVNKMAYGYSRHSCPFSMCPIPGRIFASQPERGDVVVFKHPVNGEDYIKRLVGLPGDKVQVKNGLLHINGTAVKVEQTTAFEEQYEPQGPHGNAPACRSATGGICLKDRAIETMPDNIVHSILNIDDRGPLDNTKLFTVPADNFFFMGDNRDNSTDSRVDQRVGGVGFVPFENLVGRADRVIFSSAGTSILAFWTWRSDRYFKAIK